jgi:hypothetical protein
MSSARDKVTQSRIDTAVGGIKRLIKGLPLDSLLLMRDMVNEAVRKARAR